MRTNVQRLILMRHAKAEPAGPTPDELRPLALKGRRQAAAAATMFNELGLAPDAIWCSSALRTRQTLELISGKLAQPAPVSFRPEIYVARARDLIEMVQQAGAATTLMVVGHEPTMSATAALLANEDSDQGAYQQVRVGVPTASFTVLESALPWEQWDSRAIALTMLGRPVVD